MAEPNLEESIDVLLARVPEPIRNFVLAEFSASVQRLMDKHQLHVDQGGVLQRELLLMLVGQEEPAEFMKELRASGIPEETVQALVRDINEEIFKPLRKREEAPQKAPEVVVSPQPVAAPAAPPTPDIPVDARGVRTMQADVETQAQVQPAPQQQVWQAQPYAQPQYPPMQPAYTPYPPPYMPAPQPQTYWVPVSVAQPPQPAPQYQYVPQPQTSAPTPPTPEPPVATPPPTPQPWAPPSAATPPQPQAPLTKEFGADPYREPI